MASRHMAIFVPKGDVPYDQLWAETVFGRIVRPLVEQPSVLRWFWFARYDEPPNDKSDYDLGQLPSQFIRNGLVHLIRFRFELPDSEREQFEKRIGDRIKQEGCWFTDVRDYGGLGELGGGRFCGTNVYVKPSQQRADLVTGVLWNLAKLTLHALIGPDNDGRYRLEANIHEENPLGSSFESLHHLFCNMTGVPLDVIVASDGNQQHVFSRWMKLPNGWSPVNAIRVNF